MLSVNELIRRIDALEIVKRTSGDYVTAFLEIKHLPTIDAEPVIHAAWKPDFCLSLITCTHCKHSENYGAKPNYCPHCGAKMDLQEEKNETD